VIIRFFLSYILIQTLLMGLEQDQNITNPHSSKWYEVNVDIEYLQLDQSIIGYSDSGKISTSIDAIYKASIEATLFPDSYNLKFLYSRNVTPFYDENLANPAGFDDGTSTIVISGVPWYSKDKGGIFLAYAQAEFNGQFTNNTGSSMNFWQGSSALDAVQSSSIALGTSFKSKDTMDFKEISYLFPESSIFPQGFNLSYTIATRELVTVQEFRTFPSVLWQPVFVYAQGESSMIGLGVERDRNKLDEGLSLRRLKYAQGSMDTLSIIDIQEISAGISYKRGYSYVDFDYLQYSISSDDYTIGLVSARMPKHTSSILYLKAGISF